MNTTQTEQTKCRYCAGTGSTIRLYAGGKVECRKCHGTGEVSN